MYYCLCVISVSNITRKLTRILSVGIANSVKLELIIKSRLANKISSLAIVSLRFLAVGFSTVYGIVICNPLIANIWCIV